MCSLDDAEREKEQVGKLWDRINRKKEENNATA
jgi:hypothetical protein